MEKNVDICIVGGSGAGLSAAITAKQAGAESVLVLEKMRKTGGCTQMCGGLFGIGSPVQKRKGLDYDVDQAFRDLIQVLNWNVDAKLIRKWISGSGESIRWLEELGMEFGDVIPFSGLKERIRATYHIGVAEDSGLPRTGRDIARTLFESCMKLGVEVKTQCRVNKLKTDSTGTVTGLMAETMEGELSVNAKCVVLATGSISANKELIKRFYLGEEYEDIRIMANVPHNTGDGHLMAEEIGAVLGRVSTLFIGPHNHFPGASEVTGAAVRRPQVLAVNRNGERFVDEAWVVESEFGWMKSVNIDRQPGKICYVIFDKTILDDMIAKKESFNCVDFPMGASHYKDKTEWLNDIDEHVKLEEKAGRARICSDIDEIARYIGCDARVFKETVENYNRYCEEGYDEEFLKEPRFLLPLKEAPYYVINGPSGIDTCIGGLTVDNHQRVLNREYYPIEGLLGAGVLTSGWLAGVYAFFGSELSYTIYSGRVAGKNAAEYVADI